MNAIDFLINEHNKVKTIFSDINNKSYNDETKMKMFHSLCQEIIMHENMEHEIWYPHFKNNKSLTETVKHLLTEENHAEREIKQFETIETQDQWEEKFKKFQKDVEYHANEEEQKLFPEVKKILNAQQLESIGKEMIQYKKKYSS